MSLMICSEHDREDIAYEDAPSRYGNTCPACSQVSELKDEIKELESKLEESVSELKDRNEELKELLAKLYAK